MSYKPKWMQNLDAFMSETDADSEAMLKAAEERFGHPTHWPRPPRKMPRWWQFHTKRLLHECETWFGPLGQEDLDAFWAESRKGQSAYEDAGGYVLRMYRALVALPTEEPVSYEDAFDYAISRGRQP